MASRVTVVAHGLEVAQVHGAQVSSSHIYPFDDFFFKGIFQHLHASLHQSLAASPTLIGTAALDSRTMHIVRALCCTFFAKLFEKKEEKKREKIFAKNFPTLSFVDGASADAFLSVAMLHRTDFERWVIAAVAVGKATKVHLASVGTTLKEEHVLTHFPKLAPVLAADSGLALPTDGCDLTIDGLVFLAAIRMAEMAVGALMQVASLRSFDDALATSASLAAAALRVPLSDASLYTLCSNLTPALVVAEFARLHQATGCINPVKQVVAYLPPSVKAALLVTDEDRLREGCSPLAVTLMKESVGTPYDPTKCPDFPIIVAAVDKVFRAAKSARSAKPAKQVAAGVVPQVAPVVTEEVLAALTVRVAAALGHSQPTPSRVGAGSVASPGGAVRSGGRGSGAVAMFCHKCKQSSLHWKKDCPDYVCGGCGLHGPGHTAPNCPNPRPGHAYAARK